MPSSDAGPRDRLRRLDVEPARRTPTAGRGAAGCRRRGGRSSRRWRRAGSAAARAGPGRPPRGRRAGARAGARIASGERSLIRAAASSMASGMPCSRAAIAATAGAFSLVTAKAGPDGDGPLDEQADRRVLADRGRVERRARRRAAASARVRRGWTDRAASAAPAPGTPARPRRGAAARLVAIAFRPGAARSRPAMIGPASTHLLEVVEDQQDALAARATRRATSAIGLLARSPRCRAPPRSAARRASGRGSAPAARRRRRPGSVRRGRRQLEREPRLPGPAGPGHASAGGSSRAGDRPRRARRSRPTNVVSWVGRLFGRASSVRSGGNSVGSPSRLDLEQPLRRQQVAQPVLAELAER